MNLNKNSTSKSIRANKKLGQHFLIDKYAINQIIDSMNINNKSHILEIGPGQGALTFPLLNKYKRLTTIEIDTRMIPILEKGALNLGDLTVINKDILSVDLNSLLDKNSDYKCFGNLPYNLSTPILFNLISIPVISEMVFLLQKELVERIAAYPGNKDYGQLSIILQQSHDIFSLFDIPPSSFSPPPKVNSSVVKLIKRKENRWVVSDDNLFKKVVKTAFSMRRKTLRNNLKPIIKHQDLLKLDIDDNQRAEQLDGAIFAKITNYLYDQL